MSLTKNFHIVKDSEGEYQLLIKESFLEEVKSYFNVPVGVNGERLSDTWGYEFNNTCYRHREIDEDQIEGAKKVCDFFNTLNLGNKSSQDEDYQVIH